MVVLGQPHGEYIEFLVAGKHRVERGEIAERFFHDLRSRIDENAMHGGRDGSQPIQAARSHKKTKPVFALCLLVERTDDLAEVIDLRVCGPGSCSGFERCEIMPAHDARQYADLEERNELLLGVDLTPRCRSGLGPPCRTQDAVAVEGHEAGEEAGS